LSYWSIGQHISRKTVGEGWGQGTVEELAETIRRRYPTMKGFSASNLWRMSQFFETYRDEPELAPLVRELSWTHNLLIMSRCKRFEEHEFYLRLAARERWGKRELERQLAGALFERVILSPPKLSTLLAELHPEAGVNAHTNPTRKRGLFSRTVSGLRNPSLARRVGIGAVHRVGYDGRAGGVCGDR